MAVGQHNHQWTNGEFWAIFYGRLKKEFIVPSVEVILALTGATSVLGVIALAGNFYLYLKIRAIEAIEYKSVREVIEGEGLLKADQVPAILQAFESGADRLQVLKLLAKVQSSQGASRVYEKIKGEIDVKQLEKQRFNHLRRITFSVAPFFFLIACTSLVYGAYSNPEFTAAVSNFLRGNGEKVLPKPNPSPSPSPQRLGQVTIFPKLKTVTTETSVHPAVLSGGRGIDSVVSFSIKIIPELAKQGWKIDVEKLMTNGITWSQEETNGGSGSSCMGLDKVTVTDDGFSFLIRFGHKTDVLGHKSDALVTCNIRSVPLVRKAENYTSGEPIARELMKGSDLWVSLPSNTISYMIKLAIDGSGERVLTDDSPSPFDFLQIMKRNDGILFKLSS
ncbi:hypothetical protein [Bradyrhizobium niftali]|uniref:Uncharacterized protein n=1 Tax=Bradyrhizobium niftali TaxID=2560055 RepID=A0A4Y9L8Y2_9BRAD|nr:hypothetical protein [Bradyrhizobium niftali]TFV39815.1 hypothetical protein E4K65_39580 [Bradyrhizobium niftali]